MPDTTPPPTAPAVPHSHLTREEWARAAAAARMIGARIVDPREDPRTHEITSFYGHRRFGAVMALANAALPDDAPHKITRADLNALWVAVGVAEQDARNAAAEPGQFALDRHDRALHALAAKLAALLPPEAPADGR